MSQVIWFLIVGAYFYAAFIPSYLLILIVLILIDYFAAFWINNSENKMRKVALSLSIVTNLSLLGVFKYWGFFNQNIAIALKWFDVDYQAPELGLVLPLGLSFHTFQSMAYTIEVYYKRVLPEKNIFVYSLYVLFYPQLVAGPIERPEHLLPQLHRSPTFDSERARRGLELMLWGFLKKVCVADMISGVVDQVYMTPSSFSPSAHLIASYLFAIQIYCDFSGYSDIARGAARLLGFELMVNFRSPYLSNSIREFWRRWHISLSSWFRDYLFIPLGGKRSSPTRSHINLLIVFMVSGFWHGANWTFVAWGLMHWVWYMFSEMVGLFKIPQKESFLGHSLRVFLTFHFVVVGWVFFRAKTLSDAWEILFSILSGILHFKMEWAKGLESIGTIQSGVSYWALAFIGIIIAIFGETICEKISNGQTEAFRKLPKTFRFSLYYMVLAWILATGGMTGSQQFIYFQF